MNEQDENTDKETTGKRKSYSAPCIISREQLEVVAAVCFPPSKSIPNQGGCQLTVPPHS